MLSNTNSKLHEEWANSRTLQVDAIIFGSGDIILMNCRSLVDPESRKVTTLVAPLARSTIDSVLEFDPDSWTYITRLSSFDWISMGVQLICGEGSMGNEGFVAVIDRVTEGIKWIAFFTCSNPFLSIVGQGREVIAENNLGARWVFQCDAPERVSVRTDFNVLTLNQQ